jgi:hypothetical protein
MLTSAGQLHYTVQGTTDRRKLEGECCIIGCDVAVRGVRLSKCSAHFTPSPTLTVVECAKP